MRFLCLHGRGTNGQILEAQTAAIRAELGDHHTYEYVDGLVASKYAPEAGDDYYDYYGDTIESKIKALSDLESLIENEGPFDGVISFSHGGVLAATYLLREAMLQPTKHAQDPTFKLAIFFSSAQAVDPVLLKDHGIQKFMTSKDGEVIRIPTAHIWGKNDDEWKAASEEVASICITEKKLTFVHDGGHEVPGSKDRSALYKAVHVIRRTIHSAQVAC